MQQLDAALRRRRERGRADAGDRAGRRTAPSTVSRTTAAGVPPASSGTATVAAATRPASSAPVTVRPVPAAEPAATWRRASSAGWMAAARSRPPPGAAASASASSAPTRTATDEPVPVDRVATPAAGQPCRSRSAAVCGQARDERLGRREQRRPPPRRRGRPAPPGRAAMLRRWAPGWLVMSSPGSRARRRGRRGGDPGRRGWHGRRRRRRRSRRAGPAAGCWSRTTSPTWRPASSSGSAAVARKRTATSTGISCRPAASRVRASWRRARSRSLTLSAESATLRKGSRPVNDMHSESGCSWSPIRSWKRATIIMSEAAGDLGELRAVLDAGDLRLERDQRARRRTRTSPTSRS